MFKNQIKIHSFFIFLTFMKVIVSLSRSVFPVWIQWKSSESKDSVIFEWKRAEKFRQSRNFLLIRHCLTMCNLLLLSFHFIFWRLLEFNKLFIWHIPPHNEKTTFHMNNLKKCDKKKIVEFLYSLEVIENFKETPVH